jgi:hypothetical protein
MDPERLTMMSMRGICMFCKTPEKETRTKHICLETIYGFYSCGKEECINKLFLETDNWWKDKSYGDVHYLKNNHNIKVIRTNGEIQYGWSILSPLVLKNREGIDIIYCTSRSTGIERWCTIEMLMEQNPEVVPRSYKNLCIDCGIDMGPINHRQYCGKYMCSNAPVLDETLDCDENDAMYIAYPNKMR